MIPLSVLDLSVVTTGTKPAAALRNSIDLARHVDGLGYVRYWLAEHHNLASVASPAPDLMIGQIAAVTKDIRVGSGGVMLPNHAPLVVAERFKMLEALFPGRIDLGLGRAPGSDPMTARALRRNLASDADEFPRDVLELMDYLSDEPQQRVRAVPGTGANVPVWILGSSLYGSQLAAMLGLPYAFASHFAPQQLMDALHLYRSTFKPSRFLDRPYAMVGFNVFATDTDDEARVLATSMQQSFVNLRSGRPGRLPPPRPGYYEQTNGAERALLDMVLTCTAVGSPATVRDKVREFLAETRADEVIVAGAMFDHRARLRSYEIAAQVLGELGGG
jgi:luciferase family oxidoreductase group 1